MSAYEERRGGRVARKLTKRTKDPRKMSFDVPDRFRDGEDAQDDVTAPKGAVAKYMNQSIFSMIAAAGSKVDFQSRFDEESSDSGEDDEDSKEENRPASTELGRDTGKHGRASSKEKQRSRTSEHKLLRSLPRLNIRAGRHQRSPSGRASASDSTATQQDTVPIAGLHDAPLMSRMLEAQTQYNTSELGLGIQEREDKPAERRLGRDSATALETKLMEIFEFESPEDVISEYPCWLLQSVLLQGYMYITTRHICFYAYLPKKTHIIAKSGYLSKRGRQSPKYNRYWFTLKGDVLSYYTDPSDLYFPSGNIDLRYGISSTLVDQKEKGKKSAPSTTFTVTTHQRTYYFKADSAASAKEWVKTLQKVIFRSHNDGDSVKISLPLENVIDIEDSSVIDFAETCKIRVVDNDETYAIDEYFFSFFQFGKEAINVLRLLVEDTPAQKLPEVTSPLCETTARRDSCSPSSEAPKSRSPARGTSPALKESVRRTLSPLSPVGDGRSSPRLSAEWGRSSFDGKRRSIDLSRDLHRSSFEPPRRSASYTRKDSAMDGSPRRPGSSRHVSSDSFVHSIEQDSASPDMGLAAPSALGTSASQILDRSDVFQSPTIRVSESDAQTHSNDSKPNPDVQGSQTGAKLPKTADNDQRPHAYHSSSRRQWQTVPQQALSESDSDREGLESRIPPRSPSPGLQELVKAGAYPLQRAAGFAGYLKNHSKRMSNLLATESMGYLEKVSGMWIGGRKHYGASEEPVPNDHLDSASAGEEPVGHGDRFRAHFALPSTEKLQASYFGYLHRVLPLYGKIYIGNLHFCFRSLLPGTRTKLILPLKDVENVEKEKGFRFGYSGLVVVIRGHEELFFEFSQQGVRDDCAVTLHLSLDTARYLKESGLLTQQEKEEAEAAKTEHRTLQQARQAGHVEHEVQLPKSTANEGLSSSSPLILFDDPRASVINFKPTQSLRVTCLTIGSRGDVQPYIALCKGLLAEGHKPKIATHAEFEPWVRKHGIDFAPIDGDPAELMRICVENGMFTYSFLKEASAKFRGWIDELLGSAWTACQNSDILIESPSAMAGIHIAEALQIPYFRAFTMPWTRTRAYPHAFAVPEHKMGGAYNYFSYVMFDNVFWKAIAGQVNRWRKRDLGLPRTSLDKLQPNKVPFLYNFSPSVVVPPLDYSDWIRVTGYWFLDEGQGWEPPKELLDFIQTARSDGKKIVYVGFGSIVVSDSAALTRTVIDSVLKADVRCILSKGWSDRLDHKGAYETEVPLPKEILQIKSAPHDWLFQQIDAAAHHGGAGTTGASLRAGLPTIVKPFFGDQFFFGSRVEDLGVGIYVKKLNVSVFSRALWEATHSERMIAKARVLGEQIRRENGVDNAIQAIYRDMEYAKSLIKKNDGQTLGAAEESEESWTFIGDESDPDLARRIAEWDPSTRTSQTRQSPVARKTSPQELAAP